MSEPVTAAMRESQRENRSFSKVALDCSQTWSPDTHGRCAHTASMPSALAAAPKSMRGELPVGPRPATMAMSEWARYHFRLISCVSHVYELVWRASTVG